MCSRLSSPVELKISLAWRLAENRLDDWVGGRVMDFWMEECRGGWMGGCRRGWVDEWIE